MITTISIISVFIIGAMVGASFVYRKSQGLFMINKSLRINYEFLLGDHNELKKHYWELQMECSQILGYKYFVESDILLLEEYRDTLRDKLAQIKAKEEIEELTKPQKTGE
jgi:predicted  nucleic acid-binding Zn-ribbon protein